MSPRSRTGARRLGTDRERAVRALLEQEGWLAFRAPASLGCADVVALRAGDRPRLIEVKSIVTNPYEGFRRPDRARLSAAALQAGADAFLAWWPPRGELRWIASSTRRSWRLSSTTRCMSSRRASASGA